MPVELSLRVCAACGGGPVHVDGRSSIAEVRVPRCDLVLNVEDERAGRVHALLAGRAREATPDRHR